MNVIALISAILFGSVAPISVELPDGIKAGAFLAFDEYVVAAVVPDALMGFEEKQTVVSDAAESLACALERDVVLTQDLLTYMTILRILKRGADRYERDNMASRIPAISESCRYATKKSAEAG